MKKLLSLLSIVIIFAALYFVAQNTAQSVQFTLLKGIEYKLPLFVGLSLFFAAGFVAGLAWIGSYFYLAQNKLKEYRRKLEQTSIGAEDSDSRVSVLEAKIQVLEKALKSALEKND